MTTVDYSVELLEKQLQRLLLKDKPKLLVPCPIFRHTEYQNKCSYCRDYVGAEIYHKGEIDIELELIDKKTCAYCHNTFESRNQLFSHLRCMGVDTTPTHLRCMGVDTTPREQNMDIDMNMSCGVKRRHTFIPMDVGYPKDDTLNVKRLKLFLS